MKDKCKHHNCDALKYGNSDEVAVPDEEGRVTLLDNGNQVDYQSWMKGNCLDCITAITEFEGEMSETPESDYLDSNISNQGWL